MVRRASSDGWERTALKKIAFAVIAVTVMTASASHAQATRTWVSGVGDDANPCSRTAPCKTFAGAISKTAAGGYIDALDPGGFGAVTITKSITIDGGPGLAGILATVGTSGIIVNSSTAIVVLRNLSIEGAGTGANGIRVIAAAQVHVENVTITNFANNGILFSATGDLFVRDTSVKDVMDQGIYAQSGRVTLEHVTVNGNGFGVLIGSLAIGSMRHSMVAGNGTGVAGAYSASVHLNLEDVNLSQNGYGAMALHGSTIRFSNCSIGNNSTAGMFNDGSSFLVSYGNNKFANNPVDGTFTSTVVVK